MTLQLQVNEFVSENRLFFLTLANTHRKALCITKIRKIISCSIDTQSDHNNQTVNQKNIDIISDARLLFQII